MRHPLRTRPLPLAVGRRLAWCSMLALGGAVALPAAAQEFPPNPAESPLRGGLPGANAAARDMGTAIDDVCPTLGVLETANALDAEQVELRVICGRMINTSRGGAQGPEAGRLGGYGLEDDELNDALQSIAGEEVQTVQSQLTEVRGLQTGNLLARLAILRARMAGGLGPSASLWQEPVDVAQGEPAVTNDGAPLLVGDAFGDLGVFLTGTLKTGDKDDTFEADGFDFDQLGLTLGADYRVNDNFIVGAAFGFSDFDADIDSTGGSPAGQEVESDTYLISAFGSFLPTEQAYIDVVGTVGFSEYDTTRRVVIIDEAGGGARTVDETARGDFDAVQYGVSINGGYQFSFGSAAVTPLVRAEYVYADIDDFTEDGAGGLDLEFDDQEAESLTTSLGFRASYAISTETGVLLPQLRAEWIHEFLADDDGALVKYAVDPTDLSEFRIATEEEDEDYFLVGAGLSFTVANGFGAFVDYETVLGLSDFDIHQVSAGVRQQF